MRNSFKHNQYKKHSLKTMNVFKHLIKKAYISKNYIKMYKNLQVTNKNIEKMFLYSTEIKTTHTILQEKLIIPMQC